MQLSSPVRPVAAPPTVAALFACGYVHQDDVSRKASLLSIHAGFQAGAYPAPMPRQFLYLALTDGHGPTLLAVRLVDGRDEPLFSFELPPVRFGSPLDLKEVAIEVPAVTLPRAGLYRWQVVCAGEVIHERKLPAIQVAG
jgi:hypothetical protein